MADSSNVTAVSSNDDLLPAKVPVDGECPECGAAALARYPVLSAGGWFEAVKCQRCLASVSRVPWHRLGWVRLTSDGQER
jgi:hypothetical protein